MRHGSHGDACFRRFADYRKREETKQPRGGWPTSPTRLSRRPSVSGSPALPWTTPGCGRLRREPGRRRQRCTRPRPGWPCARRPLTTPRPSRCAGAGRRRATTLPMPGPGRRRTRPRGRRAGVVADQEDRTTAPGPRLRLGLPRDLCRAASCWPCDRVVWAASLPCIGPLTHGRRPRRQHLLLLHVVACYKRSSGVLAAGRAGDERVSGPRYRGLRIG
jgi:hypothetical protein